LETLSYLTTPEQDRTLMERLRAGDSTAFKLLHDRYAQALYAFIFSKISDEAGTQDILQEIFLWLWNNRAHVVIEKSIQGYLFGMAKFKCINYGRWVNIREGHTAHLFYMFGNDVDNSLQDYLDVDHVIHVIESVLATSGLRAQYAFRLSRFEMLSIEEIAERMNISRRTVENYISTILTILRPLLINVKDGIRKDKDVPKKRKRKTSIRPK